MPPSAAAQAALARFREQGGELGDLVELAGNRQLDMFKEAGRKTHQWQVVAGNQARHISLCSVCGWRMSSIHGRKTLYQQSPDRPWISQRPSCAAKTTPAAQPAAPARRRCLQPDCPKRLPPNLLMCLWHWQALPIDLREQFRKAPSLAERRKVARKIIAHVKPQPADSERPTP